jgi:hypothetical protein
LNSRISIYGINDAINEYPEYWNLYSNQGQSFSVSIGKYLRQNGSRILSDSRVTIDKIQEGHLKEMLKRAKSEKTLHYIIVNIN